MDSFLLIIGMNKINDEMKFALTLLHSAKKEQVSYRSILIINNTFSTMTLISTHCLPTKANNDTSASEVYSKFIVF